MAKRVEIKGLKQLLKKLEHVEEVVKEDVDVTIREGVNDMNNIAVRLISSQGIVDTGFLQNNQQFKTEATPRSYSMVNSAKYAPYHEFGTGGMVRVDPEWGEIAAQFKGRGIRIVNIKPRPFFVPAFNQGSRQIIADVTDLINDALK
jgi:HK97 gp10 family phage protein